MHIGRTGANLFLQPTIAMSCTSFTKFWAYLVLLRQSIRATTNPYLSFSRICDFHMWFPRYYEKMDGKAISMAFQGCASTCHVPLHVPHQPVTRTSQIFVIAYTPSKIQISRSSVASIAHWYNRWWHIMSWHASVQMSRKYKKGALSSMASVQDQYTWERCTMIWVLWHITSPIDLIPMHTRTQIKMWQWIMIA